MAALGQRPIMGTLLGQREGGPIVGALMRMRPEARVAVIRELAIGTVADAAGRVLSKLIELNLAEFLRRAVGRGVTG